jgi:hypothetical protein
VSDYLQCSPEQLGKYLLKNSRLASERVDGNLSWTCSTDGKSISRYQRLQETDQNNSKYRQRLRFSLV